MDCARIRMSAAPPRCGSPSMLSTKRGNSDARTMSADGALAWLPLERGRSSRLLTNSGRRFAVRETRPPSKSFMRGFMVVFDTAVEALAMRVRSAPALRLFLLLSGDRRLDFESWRQLHQERLAAELGTDRAVISRALKELLAVGVLERRGSNPRIEWRLSLDVGWRGSAGSYQDAKRKRGLRGGRTPAELTTSANASVAECILWKVADAIVSDSPRSCRRSQARCLWAGAASATPSPGHNPYASVPVRRAPTRSAHPITCLTFACVRCGARWKQPTSQVSTPWSAANAASSSATASVE